MLLSVILCRCFDLAIYTDSFNLICSYALSIFSFATLEKFVSIEKVYDGIDEIY